MSLDDSCAQRRSCDANELHDVPVSPSRKSGYYREMKQRGLVVALLFVGAVLLAVGTFTRSWVTADGDTMSLHVGLRDVELCTSGDCTSFTYISMLERSSRERDVAVAVTGIAAFVLGALAMVLAVVTAGLVLARVPKSVLGVLTLISVVLAALASFVFVGTLDKSTGMSFGFSIFVFETGFVLTLLGAISSLSPTRSGTPDAVAVLTGTPPGPPCSRCSRPATFVAQYQRYFCTSCNAYL